MRERKRGGLVFLLGPVLMLAMTAPVAAQATLDAEALPNWAELPDGRHWGAVTGVYPDPDGEHMWVLDRCGENSCLGSDLHPVFKFDLDGDLVANFGAGLFA